MARKKKSAVTASKGGSAAGAAAEKDVDDARQISRPPAEVQYVDELAALAAADSGPRPAGWRLTPRAVCRFVLGDDDAGIARKFYGDDALVERAVVTLASNRGLMLVGEPGTAKSLLSELLAAAVSGSSLLTIQGTAGTTEDQIKYSFNYARLLAEGPSREALVPAPLYVGLERGAIVRFEEITRCQPEIQDVMISVLSDRVLLVPELEDEQGALFARRGFNVIATANTRDRGVHEMSSALKRRFNFETVRPLADAALETDLVLAQARALVDEAGAEVQIERDVIALLVTTFHDLRHGRAEDGTVVERPSTVVSTAEAVAACYSAALDAAYLGDGRLEPRHLARQLSGTVFKDEPEDARRLRHYFDVVVKDRAEGDERWRQFYDARREL